MTKEKLESFLRTNNIPLGEWGKGDAKTVDDLLKEVQASESVLSLRGTKVIREVTSLLLDIYYKEGSDVWRLVEEKQVFADGRTRVRSGSISMGEKMTADENSEAAIHRGLEEELGISGLQSVIERPMVREELPSTTYPGIVSRHTRHRYDVVLQTKDFKPEGYIEVQPTKSTYFVWKRADAIPDL